MEKELKYKKALEDVLDNLPTDSLNLFGDHYILRTIVETALAEDVETEEQCALEGWAIFESDVRGPEIQRIDSMEVFETDTEAVEFVKACAISGSVYHRNELNKVGLKWWR